MGRQARRIGITDRHHSYIVATSSVDTANTVFALVALLVLDQPRTGVMVAFDGTNAPLDLPILLTVVLPSGVSGFVIVTVAGEYYLTLVRRVEYTALSIDVLAILAVLSALFTGIVGIPIFVVASGIGLVPVRLGVHRVHLMDVLLGPLVLSAW